MSERTGRAGAAGLGSDGMRTALDGAAIVAAVGLTLVFFVIGLGIEVWRHDSLYYLIDALGDYSSRLTTEGRWLIALLYRPLLALPGPLVWAAGHVLFAAFAFRLARSYAMDGRAALLFALMALQIPSATGQSLWPVGTFGGPMLLCLAAWVHDRMHPFAFYALFGLLFFGVSQQYYFFLPLLHVPTVLAAEEGPLRATLRLLLFWVLGFAAGALFALGIVYATAGVWGLPIPEWREPHYATDLPSLLDNVASRARLLAEHLSALGAPGFAGVGIVSMALLGSIGRSRSEIATRLAIFGAVALAIYAATLPIGVLVHFRTATPLFLALLAFGFLGSVRPLHRTVYPLGVLLVFVPFWLTNVENLRWFRAVSDGYREELLRAVPDAPESYAGLMVVGGTARALQRRIETETGLRPRHIVPLMSEASGWDTRWRPAARAAGFRSILSCGPACMEDLRLRGFDPSRCARRTPFVCVHAITKDGYLLFSFVDPVE